MTDISDGNKNDGKAVNAHTTIFPCHSKSVSHLQLLAFAHSVLAVPVPRAVSVFLALGPEAAVLADFLDLLELPILLADPPPLAVFVFLALERSLDALLLARAGPNRSHTFPPALTIFVTLAHLQSSNAEEKTLLTTTVILEHI